MLAWVPMASMVTVQPCRAKVESNSGMAVFSFDFSAVAHCPRTNPAFAAKAETRCRAVASTPPERRLVFPSRATTWPPSAGKWLLTQRRNAAANSLASMSPNSRPKVSCEGMPLTKRKYFRNHSIFSLAHSSISTNVSAPTNTALTATTNNSTRSCSTFQPCLGSVMDTNTSASRNLLSVCISSLLSKQILHPPDSENNLLGSPPLIFHAIALASWLGSAFAFACEQVHFKWDFFICDHIPAHSVQGRSLDLVDRDSLPGEPFRRPELIGSS